MNNDTKDIRYALTEEDLLTAFDLLCREKAPEKLTVAEITRKTGITRSTFYNHYEDMPHLIASVENKILNDVRDMLHLLPAGVDQPEKIIRAFFSSFCRYIRGSHFLIQRLKTLGGEEFLERTVQIFHEYIREAMGLETDLSPARAQMMAYVMSYSFGGLFGTLRKWASEECNDSPEAVASLLARIYFNGVSSFF